MSKSIKIVLQEKVDLKKFFKNLKENYNQGPLDYNIQEVILEDKEDFPSSSDPEQADVLANKRLDPKIVSKPGLKELLSLGFVPIVKPRAANVDSAELGFGIQGTVYEVTKGGKRYAAKVSSVSADGAEQEFEVRKKIENIRSQLPDEVAKHVVKCFHIGKSEDETHNIYVMEIVRPMSSSEYSFLYNRKPPSQSSVMQMFTDSNFVYETIKNNFIKSIKTTPGVGGEEGQIFNSSDFRHMFFESLVLCMKEVYPSLNFKKFIPKNKNEISTYALANWVATMFSKYLSTRLCTSQVFNKAKKEQEVSSFIDQVDMFKFIKAVIIDTITTNMSPVGFDRTHKEYAPEEIDRMTEETKKFTQAMVYLSKTFDIKWADLHGGNVLMRSGTNEYVATDIGLFNLPGSNQNSGEKKTPNQRQGKKEPQPQPKQPQQDPNGTNKQPLSKVKQMNKSDEPKKKDEDPNKPWEDGDDIMF